MNVIKRAKNLLMNLETMLSLYTCDIDFTSLYPSIMRALNTSRMTMTFAPIQINDEKDRINIERYFGNLVNVRENTVILCSEYYGLPSYSEMHNIINDIMIEQNMVTI